MKALVTGGAGFIGSHLCERLLERGWDVAVIDDLSTGRLSNIEHILDNQRFRFVQGSVRHPKVMESLVSDCDAIFHLAAAVGVQLIVDRPVHTIETNIHGTEVVLEVANRFKKKVLVASTSEVYGKNEQVPFHEDDDTLWGSTRFSRWSYACSKAIDEFLAFAYHDQFGLDVIIARIFNTIGPRQVGQYGMVVPRFIKWALKNEPVLVYGDGQQSRCFGFVGDVADGLIGLISDDKAAGRVYNIGSDEEITIEGLADLVIAKTHSTSEKRFVPYEQAYGKEIDDMARRVPGLERIRGQIGYEPKVNLERTLDIIINYFRETVE
ncbi:MAG TPA: SDR family NAD(P)-dependent oxidoreductase [Planctomycetes bacterium]|nr:SDR family NAD(P)-dependent oxidoreductase [Planctomycetota bacterium]